MFEFVFLGTSASAPSVHRGLSAHMIMHQDYRFLVDCGEGTQRQILRSGLGFKRLDKILITHSHLDHILGLGGLLSTFARWEAVDRIEIWAGESSLQRIHDLIYRVVLKGGRTQLKVELKELTPGLIMEDHSFELHAFPVPHRGTSSFGFIFAEKTRRPFLAEKASDLGVPIGPQRRNLVLGKSVTLSNGQNINPDDVLGPPRAGAKLVHVGDASHVDDIVDFCQGADALVIESTYLEREHELASRFGHLTAHQAATLAVTANVRKLYLTHLSRRYREREVLAEAQEVFREVSVARDFDRFLVKRS